MQKTVFWELRSYKTWTNHKVQTLLQMQNEVENLKVELVHNDVLLTLVFNKPHIYFISISQWSVINILYLTSHTYFFKLLNYYYLLILLS